MRTGRPTCLFVPPKGVGLCLGLLLLVSLSASTTSEQTTPPPDSLTVRTRILLKIKSLLEEGLKIHDQNEALARDTMARASEMQRAALAQEDTKNAELAGQAIVYGELTIRRIRELRKNDQQRLEAINRALQQKFGGRSVALPLLMRGRIYKKTPGGMVPFDGSSPLLQGESVTVDKDSYLELQFEDGSQVNLGERTTFIFRGDDRKKSVYELIKGYLRSVRDCLLMDHLGCDTEREFRSSSHIFTVRGTEFLLDADESGAQLAVLQGSVEVSVPGQPQGIVVHEGEQLNLPKDIAPGKPSPFDSKSIPVWWQE